MIRFGLYMHSGSSNHGCEAIVRSISRLFNKNGILLFSSKREEDLKYQLDKAPNINIVDQGKKIIPNSPAHYFLKAESILLASKDCYHRYSYRNVLYDSNCQILLSIGGDNYCGYGTNQTLSYINRILSKRGKKTVLFGCSIEPDILKQKSAVDDMNRYSLITARESISYQALIVAGVTKNTHLIPDPAFVLMTKEVKLPPTFLPGKMIGINISPLIQRREQNAGLTYNNYRNLVDHILKNTDNGIALIPHVVKDSNNDLEPLTQLFNEFKDTGRVCLIDENKTLNCMELKYIISQCRLMVAARTHASIAAYSTCVPTLVVGYSVKAKGIAKDIFGAYEHYVIPVQSLSHEDDLSIAYQWLDENQDSIRIHLENFMPSYIQRTWQAVDEVRKLINEE